MFWTARKKAAVFFFYCRRQQHEHLRAKHEIRNERLNWLPSEKNYKSWRRAFDIRVHLSLNKRVGVASTHTHSFCSTIPRTSAPPPSLLDKTFGEYDLCLIRKIWVRMNGWLGFLVSKNQTKSTFWFSRLRSMQSSSENVISAICSQSKGVFSQGQMVNGKW